MEESGHGVTVVYLGICLEVLQKTTNNLSGWPMTRPTF
jgi:hypothetical protein